MKRYTLTFISLIFCLACINEENVMVENSGTETKDGLRFLALGDSYTIGQSVTEAERWPVLFAKSMRENSINISTTDILAKTGWTTSNLLGAISSFKAESSYDLVSLMIGVNNQFQGLPLENFRTEFHQLLLKSVDYVGGRANRVFVVSIPDWGCTPYGSSSRDEIGKSIDQFNMVVKEECAKEKILFIDITPISRLALNDPSMLANDNLHYSAKMHGLWVEKILPAASKLL